MQRQTIAKSVSLSGIGVHTGQPAQVTLAPFEDGLALSRTDTHAHSFKINPQSARPSPLCTLLVNEHGATLSTVEHLFAALHGLGITDIEIEVDGPEVPILDGSALPWVELIESAGLLDLGSPAEPLVVTQAVSFDENERHMAAAPGAGLAIDCRIEFPHPQIGSQHWAGILTPEVFKAEIAPARTFITEGELELARAAGFAKGASLEGGVLFLDNGGIANTPYENGLRLRFANEPVRHKVLDAIGDLFMAGRPVQGAFTLVRPGHTANNQLLRKIAG